MGELTHVKRTIRPLDLGDGHLLHWSWKGQEDDPVGAIVEHQVEGIATCVSAISFAEGYGPPVWKVEAWDPLTLSPSLLCRCGDHGFIREGKWVRA